MSYLKSLKSPFIAHVTINKSYQHYVVVQKIKNKSLKVMDPSCGYKNYTFEEFERIWTNVIIILYPNKNLPIIRINRSLTSFIFNLVKPF